MNKLYCLLLVFFSHTLAAQQDSVITALKKQLSADSLRLYSPKRVSFDFQFDNRNSFIRNQAIEIQGYNPGILVNRKFRYGLGLYRVIAPYQTFKSSKKSSVSDDDVVTNRELDMYFATPNFRFLFINRKWLQVGSEIAIGFGKIDYTIKNEANTKTLSHKNGLFVPSGIGLELVVIPFKWIGAGGSIGYRKSLGTYDINADFDGMYYSYGVKVFVGRIYKDIKFRSWKKQYTEKLKKLTNG